MNVPNDTIPTIIERFYHWERTTPDRVFLRQPKGDQWLLLSYAQAGQEARKMASALRHLGLRKGDHVGIYSKNCYHWILADLAIMMGGFVSVPLYAALPKDQLAEVVALGDLKAIFLGKLDSWGEKRTAIPADTIAIRFPHYAGNTRIAMGKDWDQLVEAAEPAPTYVPNLDDLWTIKFTSGTTSTPKGVMHIHRSPALIMRSEAENGRMGYFDVAEPRFFSYLPLNHIAERLGLEIPAIWLGASISFAESLDSFAKNLRETQPNMFFAVPRIWTKFYLGVLAKIPLRRLELLLKIPLVAGLMKKKLRRALGMQNIQLAGTGAAITPVFIKDFYRKLGIHLIEVYGMTETCGMITSNTEPDAPQDSVGTVVPYGTLRIHPDTGEVLMKTPYLMTGYYRDPQKTAEVLIDGWMHTGDRGSLDEAGYLRITGRIKDAFKTTKGSYITPNVLEKELAKNDYIEQVCVVGLGVPQPLALIHLSEIGWATHPDRVDQVIARSVERLNANRINHEKIARAIILREAWTIENGLLTPTLKLKRGSIDQRYAEDYLRWYASKKVVVWA